MVSKTKKEEKLVKDGRGRVRNYAKEYARKKELKIDSKTKTNVDSQKILKQVSNASDSTKELSKEVKSMSKIFAENQKVLISMKTMIDALSTTLNQIQKQSKQINIIEEDTKKVFSDLNKVKANDRLVSKLNEQTNRIQEKITRIEQVQKSAPKTDELIKTVAQSIDSIRNNSKMIMKVADRVDSVKDDVKTVSKKSESVAEITKKIADRVDSVKDDVKTVSKKSESVSGITQQINELRKNVQSISSRSGNLGNDMSNLKNELGNMLKTPDYRTLIEDGLKPFKSEIEGKLSNLSNTIKRSEELTSEFHKKTDRIFTELDGIKNVTSKSSSTTSKEVIALLKLSEYQSSIRIQSESKYGTIKEIENMSYQTAQIVNLFDKLSIESDEKIPLPDEVRGWAISKILDCSDRWELRFSDIFNVIIDKLGRDMVKESINIQQVRDIFGIRAVDEIRKELNIS
jgi:chromosome segregation ATPase